MLRVFARRATQQVQCYTAVSRGFATPAPAEKPMAPDFPEHLVKNGELDLMKDGELDWDAIGDAMGSDSSKRELQQLRSTYIDYGMKMDDLMQEPEPIDWADWKKKLDPQLVSDFEKAYNTIPEPKYEDQSLVEANEAFQDVLKQAEELAQHSAKRTVELEQEIKDIDAEMEKLSHLTIDDCLEADPKLREKLQAEIAQGKFMV